MRKSDFRICENKDAADQGLCFRYIDTTIPLVPKSEISSLLLSSVAAQPGLCGTCSETQKRVFSRRGSTHLCISCPLDEENGTHCHCVR